MGLRALDLVLQDIVQRLNQSIIKTASRLVYPSDPINCTSFWQNVSQDLPVTSLNSHYDPPQPCSRTVQTPSMRGEASHTREKTQDPLVHFHGTVSYLMLSFSSRSKTDKLFETGSNGRVGSHTASSTGPRKFPDPKMHLRTHDSSMDPNAFVK